MKKSLITILATLAVPAMAFGLAVSVDLTDADTGLSTATSLDGNFAASLVIGVNSDEPLTGIQYNILVNGAGNGAFHAFTDSFDSAYLGSLFDTSARPGTNLWVAGDVNSPIDANWPNGQFLDIVTPEVVVSLTDGRDAGGNDMSVFPGTLLTYDITASGLAPGVYNIALGDGGLGFVAGNGNGEVAPASAAFVLTVVPEPASALLLLAAVPFLRRRSA